MPPTIYTTCSNPKCLTKFSTSSLQNSPTPSLILCLHCQGRVCECDGPKQPEVERCIRCRNRSLNEVIEPPTKAIKAKSPKTSKTSKPRSKPPRERKRTLPSVVNSVDVNRLGHLTLVHSTPKAKVKTPK